MRIYAILMLLVLAASAFASYTQAMTSIVAFDKERVAYASSVSAFYALKYGVKYPRVNASENTYYFYSFDSNYRFSTQQLGGVILYPNNSQEKNILTISPGDLQNALSGPWLHATNGFVAAPDMSVARGQMLYASRDYVASAAQAMLDSISYARSGLAQMPNSSDKMQLDYQLSQYEQTFASRVPQVRSCTNPATVVYYAALTANDIDSAKPLATRALAAYARFETAKLKQMMNGTMLGNPQALPDYSDPFAGFNDYHTFQTIKSVLNDSGY